MASRDQGVKLTSVDGISDVFPVGLRVLVVDDDPTCLMVLEKMLQNCLYKVTKCNRAEIALSLLRENRNGFDVVISDVHMPDMDGFKLLEHVGLEMELPVIMMSADDSKDVVMKGVTHGACDYLIKPVRIEALRNIWQHVVRKRKHEWNDNENSGSIENGERQQKQLEDADISSPGNEGNWRNSKRRNDEENQVEDIDDMSSLKKPRVVWSVELHQQFVVAVNQLGIDKAVPKKLLDLMNVPGLTRENVASHLQKYRLYLRRISGVPQQLNNAYVGPLDPSFGSISSLNALGFQALASTGQLPAQSLVALHAASMDRSPNKPGISMPFMLQHNLSNVMANGAALARNGNNLVSQSPTMVDFSVHQNADFQGNDFPLAINNSLISVITSNGLHEEDDVHSNIIISRRFVHSYDNSSDLQYHRSEDWELQNDDFTFDTSPYSEINGSVNVPPSVLAHQGFSSSQNNVQNRSMFTGKVMFSEGEQSGHGNVQNTGQQLGTVLLDNSLRFKAYSLPEANCPNTLFHRQFSQEDLMSALLKQQEGFGPASN